MSEKLCVVKTNVTPNIFNPSLAFADVEGFYASQAAFLDKIKEQYHGIDFPFYAIKSDGDAGLMEQQGSFGKEPLPDDAQSICDRIDELIQGDNPITAVVDFTNSKPELRGAYEILQGKYDVNIIEVMDIFK
jgi:hypothetical protein